MNIFKRRVKKKISFIKTVELKSANSWDTSYHTEVNGRYVSNSVSHNKEQAESIFEKVLELHGTTKTKEVLREEYR
jgi:hypothetical protein